MKIVEFDIKGVSAYSQSRHYVVESLQGESPDDKYQRTWREHMHVDTDGVVFIPPNAVKNMLSEAAKFLSIKIPGSGKSTYTKHFESGIAVVQPISLGVHKDAVTCERLFLPAKGDRGSGKRIWKYYPVFPSWGGRVQCLIYDETVLQTLASDPTKSVFEHVLERSGQFIGLGRFRPRNNGYYGRFGVSNFRVEELT